MKHNISSTTMPVLQIGLDPGEKIVAEPGEFSWMTENMQLGLTQLTTSTRREYYRP